MTRASFTRSAPDARRQSMIDACAISLSELGASRTSVRSICSRAGVSPGLLRHYFDGIDALISETYRHVTVTVGKTLAAAVDAAGKDPRARLNAYVTASFRNPVTDPALLSVWLAFWSLVKSDPNIAKVHGDSYRAYRADVEELLVACGLTSEQAGPVAIASTALIDGLWLELSLDPSTFTGDQASIMAIRWLDSLLEKPDLFSA